MITKQQTDFALIEEMIAMARKEVNDNGFYFLLWGWLVFIASVSQYIMIKFAIPNSAIVWLLMPIGAVISIYYGWRERKIEKVKTYMNRIMTGVWLVCGFSIIVIVLSSNNLNLSFLPVMIIIYGIGTFISGTIMRFTPLKVGAILCWALATFAFYLKIPEQLLAISLAIIVSYIIPGYILKLKSRHV